MLPAVAVDGTGPAGKMVLPVAVLYHFKFVPVAVNAVAAAFWQYVTVSTAVGGATGIMLLVAVSCGTEIHPVEISFTVTE